MDEDPRALTQRLGRWVPGVRAARTYDRSWLRADLIAGVVLAAILVPQGMAYAELAGLPAVTGLYTTIACLVGYALFGPSRVLVLGPDSSISPLILAALTPLVVAGDDPGKAIVLAGMLAILVGLVEIGLGLGKLGFVADLLSKEVQVGYMNGLAVTIIVSQLPKLFGFSTDADGFVEELQEFVTNLNQTHTATLVVGLAVLAVLLIVPRFTRTVPAILIAVVGVTVVSAALGLSDEGVATVGALPQGVPTPEIPWTDLSDVGPLLLAAIGITLVSLTDTIATATSFAARRGDEVEPDQEMVGMGAANITAGLFQGFAISTSGSRTAVAEQSGAKSQLTGLVGAGLVAVLLLFLNGLLTDLPQAALAAVVIVAAFSLSDLDVLRRYLQVRPSALAISLVATAGVILFGVLEGIVVAVVLAILLFFRRNWWPHGEVLGIADGLPGWHSVRANPGAREVPGVVVYRWEAPLIFANAGIFRQQIRHLVRERRPAWVVLQCEAITDVDVTAAEMLEQLDNELNDAGIHMAFAEMRDRLQDLVFRYGLFETLDRDHFYPTLDTAIAAIEAESRDATPPA
ncbi:SulP family inorganic anion transporter [Svornostia abyssi]|uniref:SulP family inorganic anion transporter n=1 Tax=Svornostia abyssi TaxID=2898438 RepID=A0ABY5PF61_9ACTN|nr:SulP family inorganic anion transporter [Parviterribacteraceae bacterium J379]